MKKNKTKKGSEFDHFEVSPSFDKFDACFKSGQSQVVWTRLVADLETPVSAYLKLCKENNTSVLFESVEGGTSKGRYSIIGYDPDIIWKANGNKAEKGTFSKNNNLKFKNEKLGTLQSLRSLLSQSKLKLPPELPPMSAAIFGYLGYDTIRLVETLEKPKVDTLNVPDAILIRPKLVLVFDTVRDEILIVTPVWYEKKLRSKILYKLATKRLGKTLNALNRPLVHENFKTKTTGNFLQSKSNTTEKEYYSIVEKAKDYIRAGDIFQVVLSQRFSAPFSQSSFSLYRSLRRLNPSPYLFHLRFEDFSLVGSSPEILVRLKDKKVTIRPIAGTAPRGINEEDDNKIAKNLLQDPKERAEHLMLLDLGRNDVGRVAKIGSIAVTNQFAIEKYSHVMHIVSNVEGILEDHKDCIDALMAGFPAGTVSGAPKLRAMQIIDELEKTKRGPYAGCVGYFTSNGDMDTCITLRTAIIKDKYIYVQAGAGIVFDSIAENEQKECINKAKAIFNAAENSIKFNRN